MVLKEGRVKQWFGFFKTPLRKVSFKDSEDLNFLGLTDSQFYYLLKKYKRIAAYPKISMFVEFATNELREDAVPEDVVCAAYLSGNKEWAQLANALVSLTSAWYPNKETAKEIVRVRSYLQGVLS